MVQYTEIRRKFGKKIYSRIFFVCSCSGNFLSMLKEGDGDFLSIIFYYRART